MSLLNSFREVRLSYRPCTGAPIPVVTFCADGPSVHIAYFVCPADQDRAITACITFDRVRDLRWLPVNDEESPWRAGNIGRRHGLFKRTEGPFHRYVATFHNESIEVLAKCYRSVRGTGDLTADAARFLSTVV